MSIDLLPYYLLVGVPVAAAVLVLLSILVDDRRASRRRRPVSPLLVRVPAQLPRTVEKERTARL